ncbi:SpoIID/LytB domain-containing protein [Cryomorpha ignava]|uniref:SpoIID/LytB domain-containing protein n=1 Tax=Cryomorpha ignava TaxID=101383 RepID=A0A7K3WME2_9FLAO|nr:SpoIID/LytB domain-containing protein [Cryomorpha ignava]NEN22181.1 SpoIID/LytB domain-containing protein [Cryomorpha ignava]
MRGSLLFGILILMVFRLSAEDYERVSIGILSFDNPEAVQVITEFGDYNLEVAGVVKHTLKAGERISFVRYGKLVQVSIPGKVLGQFKEPRLTTQDADGVFRIYLLRPRKNERVYDDDLYVSAAGNELKLVNRVDLEKYVAGVVEAESGKEKTLEFYKVQAIISRTYALNNLRKYWREGFNLNDQVSSQVYHGKCRWEPQILVAVRITEGKVLVDSEMKLITAAFHSNSGGETVGSETVWSGPLPYLTSRIDEFSMHGKHTTWQQAVSKEKWLAYLADKYQLPIEDASVKEMAQNYDQPTRDVFYIDPIFKIPLKDIRQDWQLKSTYFNVRPYTSDSLMIDGKGFGHGAGLSQEGAIRMGELGFSYEDILHFYYNEVHIIDLHALDFFRVE